MSLPDIEPVPEIMDLLLNSSSRFLHHIRKYNSVLSFTSCAAKVDRSLADARDGIYTFRIHSSIYHSAHTLLPADDYPSRFLQIYICDP